MAITSLGPNEKNFETDRIKLLASIDSSVYTYKISTNSVPITAFEIPQYACYNFKAPKDWQITVQQGIFHAEASTASTTLKEYQDGRFSLRVSSAGAVLGSKTAKVWFADGTSQTIANVWAPVPEQKINLVVVTISVLVLIVFETWRVSRFKTHSMEI